MAIKKDCTCGRRNVEGRLYKESDDDKYKAFEAVCGGTIGAVVAGPVGAIVGGTIAHKAASYFVKRLGTNSQGKVRYRFTCPACGKEWTEWVYE